MYKIVKRDGKVVDFEMSKIANAIRKAFVATGTEFNDDIIDFSPAYDCECYDCGYKWKKE